MQKKSKGKKKELVRKKQSGSAGRGPGCPQERGDHRGSVHKWRTHVYKAHIVARWTFDFRFSFSFSLHFFFFLVSKSIFRESCFPHATLGCRWAVVGEVTATIPWISRCKEKSNQPQDLKLFWIFSPRKIIHRHKYWNGGGRKIISECKFCYIQGGFGAPLMGLAKPPTLAPLLRLFGDSGHTFLEKGGNSSKSFNLCAKISAESGKNSNSPHSHP